MNNELKNAVLEQLGIDPEAITEEDSGTLRDIREHGIDGGFHGFIYYSDTCAFYDANRKEILAYLFELADSFGQTMAECVAGFNIVNESEEYVADFFKRSHAELDRDMYLKNALAWATAEEAAHSMENE